MAHFHIKDTVLTERRLPLPGRVVVLGRSLESDVPIPHVSVSRRHALVERTRDGYVISDLGSRNGTYVAGKQVQAGERIPVPLGESFTVGKVDIRIVPDEVMEGSEVSVGAPAAEAGIDDMKTEAFPKLAPPPPPRDPPRPAAPKPPERRRPSGTERKKRSVERRAKRDAMRWAGIGITVILLLAAGILILSIANKRGGGDGEAGAEGGPNAPAEQPDDRPRAPRPLKIDEGR